MVYGKWRWKDSHGSRNRCFGIDFRDDWHDTTHVKTDVDIFWALLIWPKKHPHFVTRPTSRLPQGPCTEAAPQAHDCESSQREHEQNCHAAEQRGFDEETQVPGPKLAEKYFKLAKPRRWTSSVCPYNVAENLSPKLLSSMWILRAVLSSKRGPGIPFSFGTIIDLYISILIHQRVIVWEPHFPCDFNDFLIVTQMLFAYLFQHMLKPPPICCFEAFFFHRGICSDSSWRSRVWIASPSSIGWIHPLSRTSFYISWLVRFAETI